MEYKNLDVMVLTYNRATYLEVMLESLCCQTATGFNIKVLNNCSTDNTIETVENVKRKYPERNIQIITNEKNLGNPGNFKRSQEIATNEYTAIFHDDDAIHPEYIDFAMNLFKKHPKAVMCSGHLAARWQPSNYDWWPLINKRYQIYTSKKSAYYNILLGRPCFASNIYKTEAYKQISYRPDLYGKLHDLIFQQEINQLGNVIFIEEQIIKYRYHMEADSYNLRTGPFPNEIINILVKTNKLLHKKNFLTKALLYYWGNHLYHYFLLKNHIRISDFTQNLIVNEILTPFDLFLLQNKYTSKVIKKIIEKFKKKTLAKNLIFFKDRF